MTGYNNTRNNRPVDEKVGIEGGEEEQLQIQLITILYGVMCHKGYLLQTHSDAAREFLSTAMASLCATAGMKETTTKAHNPQGSPNIVGDKVSFYIPNCEILVCYNVLY